MPYFRQCHHFVLLYFIYCDYHWEVGIVVILWTPCECSILRCDINNLIVLETQPGSECCGSRIDFSNNTSPTGAFQRITSGPSFYVAKGRKSWLLQKTFIIFLDFRLQFNPWHFPTKQNLWFFSSVTKWQSSINQVVMDSTWWRLRLWKR